ncbi:MAG: hypothetical protein NTV89_18965 [Proteobacteria bacterium]|nr:hypothetical protein [Pseudomonadota bacterium]
MNRSVNIVINMLAICAFAFACQSPLKPMPLAEMQQSDFERCVDTIFTATPEKGTAVALKLVRVTEKKDKRMKSFSLGFIGPADKLLPQGTVTIVHEKLGSFPLFLSPFKKDEQGIYYTAVFTRMIKQ